MPYITLGFTTGVKTLGIFCLILCAYLNARKGRRKQRPEDAEAEVMAEVMTEVMALGEFICSASVHPYTYI